MLTTVLRKSGGSVTVTIPRNVLALLGLTAGDVLGLEIEGRSLVLRRSQRVGRKRAGKGPDPGAGPGAAEPAEVVDGGGE